MAKAISFLSIRKIRKEIEWNTNRILHLVDRNRRLKVELETKLYIIQKKKRKVA